MRVSSFLLLETRESNHLGAQGIFKGVSKGAISTEITATAAQQHTQLQAFLDGTSTLRPPLTSAQQPTRVWEVVRTVAAPPSIVVK